MDTRSGEMLSSCLSCSISFACIVQNDSVLFKTLDYCGMGMLWAILMLLCSLEGILCIFRQRSSSKYFARYASGLLWSTLLFIFWSRGQYAPIFWIAIVMLVFDMLVVIYKGQKWTSKN